MKRCTTCHNEKSLDNFSCQNKSRDKHTSRCKVCSSVYNKNYRKNNLEEVRKKDRIRYDKSKEKNRQKAREYRRKYLDRTRASYWRRKYGITVSEFYDKLREQNNRCAMCNRDMDEYGRIFSVDHNHVTKKVRGLLCDPCNYGLGIYEKNKEKNKEYLDKHNCIG